MFFALIHCALICPCKVDIYFGNDISSHYVMHCPLYNIHRQQLVDSFNELNIEFTIQTILYGSETSDYNQNVKLFRAVHSFIKRSKRFE